MITKRASHEHQNIRRVALSFAPALLVAALISGFTGCTRSNETGQTTSQTPAAGTAMKPADAAATAQPARPASVPGPITQMGEYGENIYDAAKAGNWKDAETKVGALRRAIGDASQELAKSANEKNRLDTAVAALEDAVNKRNIPATMREANQVTLVAADLTVPYHPRVPVDIVRLDYYGRELEIWSAAGSVEKLKETARNMRQTWNQVRPEVEAHNGAAEAKTFNELVSKADDAQSVAQYRKLATPVLDEVDKLEKLF